MAETETVELVMEITGLERDERTRDDRGKVDPPVRYFRTELEGVDQDSTEYSWERNRISLIDKLTGSRLGQRFKVTVTPIDY